MVAVFAPNALPSPPEPTKGIVSSPRDAKQRIVKDTLPSSASKGVILPDYPCLTRGRNDCRNYVVMQILQVHFE